MDKKLPSISKFSINKTFNNNEDIYYSFIGNKNNIDKDVTEKEEISSLADLFKKGEYVFNIPVVIKTKEDIFNTKIIGKLNNYIITSNSKKIQINDIVSIKTK